MRTRILKVLSAAAALILYYLICRILGCGIPCIFHLITGLKCPGCGISRMLIAMASFSFREAFYDNALLFLLSPFLAVFLLRFIFLYITGKQAAETERKVMHIFEIMLIILLVLWGFFRNILSL